MKIYLVGGAVRDALLGLVVKEKDWVVVGSTPAEMQSLNFKQVGKEFPVFLHPTTKEEYALARMERKVGLGYSGFTFDTSANVTLEEDLARRDLTINAMAKSADGEIIDPYHGQNDLEQKLLRHVSPAFSEDPVRILRLGRFLARFAPLGFSIAPETIALMQEMVEKGEVNALVAERVWKEWVRALSEAEPVQFFIALGKAKALPILFPDFANDERGLVALDEAARLTNDATVRFAALCYAYPDSIASICARYRAPHPFRDLALLTARHYQSALQAHDLSADALVHLFTSLDVFRRKNRFEQFLLAVTAIQRAILPDHPFDAVWLAQAAEVMGQYDVQSLIAQGLSGQALADKLREERVKKLAQWLQT